MNGIDILTLVTALGAATIGGTFFGFSNFIMKALAMQPAPAGIRAMQAIDVTVLNRTFLSTLMGTALLGLVLVALAFFGGSLWAAAGAIAYIVGTFVVTMAINVPMNERLRVLAPDSAEAAIYWQQIYLKEWVFWNSVRTAAALLALVMLILGLAL
jgi:uncharacterized membrane protein